MGRSPSSARARNRARGATAALLLAWLVLAGTWVSSAVALEPKIASDLADVLHYLEDAQRSGAALSEVPLPPQVQIDARNRIQVVLVLSDLGPENLDILAGLGAVVEVQDPAHNLVQARIPLDRVEDAARLPFVLRIRLPSYGRLNFQGSVGTEGDPIVKGDLARGTLGIDGTGIRIGVISDGIGGLSLPVSTGDLPPTDVVRDERGNVTTTSGGITGRSFRADGSLEGQIDLPAMEGTALLEIIHDIAPGAQLFFAAISTDLEFVDAVRWLSGEAGGPNPRRGTPGGVDLIVNNFAFLDVGPFDGTSAASEAAAAAVAEGVAVFTSAGNAALNHYQGEFSDPDGDTFHNFGPDENAISLTIGGFGSVRAVLTWNDPSRGSSNDYNLRVFDTQGNPLASGVFGGRDPQAGTQPPRETLTIFNSQASSIPVEVRIENVGGGAAPRELSLFIIGTPVPIPHNVPSGSVASPADAADVIAVGAVRASSPDTIEPFSSQGPTSDGRLKPELVAPDGVTTSFFPRGRFLGTSAAVPHAAAVAALILGVAPRLAPPQLARALEVGGTDLGDAGADNVFGFGLVDALTAATLPQADLRLNARTFRPGDTLVLEIAMRAGASFNTGDAYIVVLLPAGGMASLVLQPDGSLRLVDGLVPLQTPFTMFDLDGPIFDYTFTAADQPGLYPVVGALVLPGRDPVDMSNWIVFDMEEFALTP